MTNGYAYYQCRSVGHEWRRITVLSTADEHERISRPYDGNATLGIVSVCHACTTERVKWISRSGASVNRYAYPDGYSQHGDEKQTATEYRHNYAESIFALFEQTIRDGAKAQ